jgi:uncharacterized membrane protein YgaE (UPF0421/DUF939 family)
MIIGYRTIKTAIGTALSIAVAEYFGLTYYPSAGILTLLCIKTTRKKSYLSARDRFIACLVGMFVSGCLFELIGYNPLVVSLVLLIIIPLNILFSTLEGLATSTVIILHIYLIKNITFEIIANELALMVIGIGFALVVNLYMPNVEKQLLSYQLVVETHFTRILLEIANYLRTHQSTWDGQEIIRVVETLEEAKHVALRYYENRSQGDQNYLRYFEMRDRQFDILERMLLHTSYISGNFSQELIVANFLEDIANAVHPGNTASTYLEALESVRRELRDLSLPTTKEELENRAALVHLVGELKRYLQIKKSLM